MNNADNTPTSLLRPPAVVLQAVDARVLATLLLFTLFFVKAFVVGYFDITVALSIVSSSGLLSVIVGTMTSALPIIAAIGLLFWVIFLPSLLRLIYYRASQAPDNVSRDIQLITTAGLTILLVAIPIFTSPQDLFTTALWLGTLAGVLIYGHTWWWTRRRLARSDFAQDPNAWSRAGDHLADVEARRLGAAFLAFGLGIFFVAILLPQMWLPAERIVLRGSSVIAYVLEDDGDWTSLLLEEDRSIMRVKSDLIQSRTICAATQNGLDPEPTPAQVILEVSDHTPDCT
jgi:hypothetical protein